MLRVLFSVLVGMVLLTGTLGCGKKTEPSTETGKTVGGGRIPKPPA
jgi:hypothetical protein